MNTRIDPVSIILVVEDVEETRDGIEKLLRADGYRVHPARDEEDAITRAAGREHPNLILIATGASAIEVAAMAERIRAGAGLTEDVPVVIFCVPTVAEGAEVTVGKNVHITRPDNFNQLRDFLQRLLQVVQPT
jgi:CheY-like chemotaxis protein